MISSLFTVLLLTQSTPASLLGKGLFPDRFTREMRLVKVPYWGFDAKEHQGEIVVDRLLAREVAHIFRELTRVKFPIQSVRPVSEFDWNDEESSAANNSSGFNYRHVIANADDHKFLSAHAFGCAIDINPQQNPLINRLGASSSRYDPFVPGTITADGPVVALFAKYGWEWGGNWSDYQDYQHFEKIIDKRIHQILKPS